MPRTFLEPPEPRLRGLVAFALATTVAVITATIVTAAPLRHLSSPSLADLDTTCAPCRDFHRFATGGWSDRHEIPAAYSSWGSFEELAERNRAILHAIVDRAAHDKKAVKNSATGKLGAYWCACMDSAAADAAGAAPLRSPLDAIDRLPSTSALAGQLATLHGRGVDALFSFRVRQDPKRSDIQIAFAGQGGLGLPDRDYYLRTDSAAVETRARFRTYVARSLALAGTPDGDAGMQADRILAFETALARASMNNVQRRDPVATYHKMPAASLRALSPHFAWDAYFAGRGLGDVDSLNVTQPDFFRTVDSLVTVLPLADWKAYLRWNLIAEAAPMLSRPFADAAFQFSRVLSGAEVMQPRWKDCLRWIDGDLGDLLGQAYVQERFPPAARERALALVQDLEAALGEKIETLDWMGPDTRARAIEKLHAFEENIGYPKTFRTYEGVEPSCASLYLNHVSANAYEARRNMAKFGQPVDRGEWFMTPPTVNAFYSSSLNTINFPAGILQPPFFDPSWDDAANYGAIGAVIGHEMTHGFDDRGRQFDARGNLRDWWAEEDAAQYQARARKVAEQFDGYTVLDTLHVNGRLTLGENIADLGGVAIAYAALQKALARSGRTTIDGFTSEQRFFLAYARVWADRTRPAALRTRVLTNPHAPDMWRVNGPLSNLPEFAKAWRCQPGDPMVRPEEAQARIW